MKPDRIPEVETAHRALQQRVGKFAARHVAVREDLSSAEVFPWDLWQAMGREGLLGIGLPKGYGGLGGDYLSVVHAGRALMQQGGNLGVVLSWLLHNAVSRFLLLGFSEGPQKDAHLGRLARGEMTVALAVSERGKGTHPKKLETSARREGDAYVLSGEKAHITNGPIANFFLVIAATGIEGDRRRFSAFLVPRDAAGLTIIETVPLELLRPSPHGGIVLADCAVPSSSVLGKEGIAYEGMVKPFRIVEDVLMMGPLVGLMERQLDLLVDRAQRSGAGTTDRFRDDVGELRALLDGLWMVACGAGEALDRAGPGIGASSLWLSFRGLAGQFQERFLEGLESGDIEKDRELERLMQGFTASRAMGEGIALARRRHVGDSVLSRKESHEPASQ